MSTKIYGGFRLDTSDLLEAHELVQRFRQALQPVAQAWTAELLARLAVTLLDETCTGLRAPDGRGSALSVAAGSVRDRLRESRRNETRDPEIDPELRITLIPSGGILLGIVRTERLEWRSAFLEVPGVREYAYWTGDSDRPPGVSEREWRERGRAWDEAFGSLPPGMVGLTTTCTTPYLPHVEVPEILTAARAIPWRARTTAVARERLLHARMVELQRRHDEAHSGEAMPFNEAWSACLEMGRWLETRDGRAAVRREARAASARLVRALEASHLLTDLAAFAPAPADGVDPAGGPGGDPAQTGS